MTLSRQTVRSRSVREMVLRLSYNTFLGNPDIVLAFHHVYEAFRTGVVSYTSEEIQAEVADLAEDGLVAVAELPTVGEMPEKGVKSTSKGRDFFKAGCPWDRVDEFTGANRI